MWALSPMNVHNNVNGVGDCRREEVYALKHPDVTAIQDALARKMTEELSGFDNVFFEICNEPYFGGVTLDWQRHIASVLADAERPTGVRHLIAQNIANGSAKVTDPDPEVSILNFHYAAPPNAVSQNFGLRRVVGFDETGFKGSGDHPYRTDGWDFLMAGGGLYNNLDYSYTVQSPQGRAVVAPPTPGGGGPALRSQLSVLQAFFARLDVVKMRPANDLLLTAVPAGATARVLAETGRLYAVYITGSATVTLAFDLPAGTYTAEWVHPISGAADSPRTIEHRGGRLELTTPAYQEDIALRLTRK